MLESMRAQFLKNTQSFVSAADGIISPGTSAFEVESLTAWKKWQSERGKEFYIVGPLLPIDSETNASGMLAKENEKASSDKGQEIEAFLEKALQERGEHSLFYISFGSTWWPNSEQLWGFVEVLIEQQVPFIFACASPRAVVPEEIVQKVQESGIGLFSKWAPQQFILAHKATGWFLSHCGQNSVVEALAEGVPMIAWPIYADQAESAALISVTLNVAYQLTEARTGDTGLKVLKRGVKPTGTVDALQREAREIIDKSRGSDGKLKRKNAEDIKKKMKLAWEEHGEAVTELRRFLNKEFP
ncbi:glycosyltransferase family 1 protein [Sphaerobolus stellatus SS14]|uniref:Glycosyltransferase family 1 protein n=1 Tax=Sphaerobolus stellatus (strain SS14) TaxID=990650 RepID=A0A0C9USE1_SPHS4|nr:glycosyltransferase family 1 protein [Sphaerobolus stellatus SS14]